MSEEQADRSNFCRHVASIIRDWTSALAGGDEAHNIAHEIMTEMINHESGSPALTCTECGGMGCVPVLFGDCEPRCIWCIAESTENREDV